MNLLQDGILDTKHQKKNLKQLHDKAAKVMSVHTVSFKALTKPKKVLQNQRESGITLVSLYVLPEAQKVCSCLTGKSHRLCLPKAKTKTQMRTNTQPDYRLSPGPQEGSVVDDPNRKCETTVFMEWFSSENCTNKPEVG